MHVRADLLIDRRRSILVSGRFGRVNDSSFENIERSDNPYTELAEIYDRVMDHVDYVSWARYLSSLFTFFKSNPASLLEIACGTCNLTLELSKLGYSMTATDLSPSMLQVATRKFTHKNNHVKLFSSSMKSLPIRYEFDAVICMYDSINYMTDRDDFISALNEAASVLKPDGLYIFDVCTVKNSQMFFSHSSMEETFGSFQYKRDCKFDFDSRIQENNFLIRKRGRQYSERHQQKIYALDEISSMIRMTPLVEIGRFDDMSFMPGSENSERVHYILRKSDGSGIV